MNMRRFIFFLIVCEFFSLACIAANKTIKGHIVDEFGKNVEFASVYVDSIYAVSDKEGNFSLVVPDGMKQKLVISISVIRPVKFLMMYIAKRLRCNLR